MLTRKLALAIAFFILIAGCSPVTEQEPDSTTNTPANLEQYFESQNFVQGIVVPSRTADLSFSISGQIEEIHVQVGDTVTKDYLLANINTDQLKQRVLAAEAELNVAVANQQLLMAGTHPSLITEAESWLRVFSTNYYALQAQLDYLVDQPRPEEIAIVDAEVEEAKIAVDTAELRLESASLKAPYQGRIIAIYKHPFEYALAGTPVIQIGDENSPAIFVEMNDIEIAGLNHGTILEIQFPTLPDILVSGTITSIQPQWDKPRDSRFAVLITLDEVVEEIHWGMTASVILP